MSKTVQIAFAVLLAFISLADPSIKQATGHIVMVGVYAVTTLLGLALLCFIVHRNQQRRYSSQSQNEPRFCDAQFDEDDQ